MEALEQYQFLFEDTFFNSLVFVFAKKYVYDVIGILGTRTNIDTAIYFTANLLAFSVNYGLGLLMVRYVKTLSSYPNYIKFSYLFNKYLFLISIFCFVGLWGGLIAFIGGLTKFKYRYFIILVTLGLVLKEFLLK